MAYLSISEACKVLGVPSSATNEEIRKQWRIVASSCHPDQHPNDPEAATKFKKMREAYQVLEQFKSGSRAVASLEDEALGYEFDSWLDKLNLTPERRAQIAKELSDLESLDKE